MAHEEVAQTVTAPVTQSRKRLQLPGFIEVDQAQLNAKVKLPKLVLGPLEFGYKLVYTLKGVTPLGSAVTPGSSPAYAKERFSFLDEVVSIKDVWFRGKLDVNLREQRAQYSKKLRLPFLNTELTQLAVVLDWRDAAAKGVLGNVLGIRLQFNAGSGGGSAAPRQQPPAQHLTRAPPHYEVQLQPRIAVVPRPLMGAARLPGAVYVKASTRVLLDDATALRDVRAMVALQEASLVWRMYDVRKVKPTQFERRVRKLAWEPLAEAAGANTAAAPKQEQSKKAPAKAEEAEEAWAPKRDIIDIASEKAREWSNAILVNSCVATRHLEEQLKDWAREWAATKSTKN